MLGVSRLGLYDDERYPGRGLLVLEEHAEDLDSLEPALAHAFIDDIQRAAAAILAETGAPRMNYAVLGNVKRHLHAHLIPRGFPGDPVPSEHPWAHPRPKAPLPAAERARIIQGLASRLQ